MKPLFEKPEAPQAFDEQKEAKRLLGKLAFRWTLYALGIAAYGVGVIAWFIVAVLMMPFTESGRR